MNRRKETELSGFESVVFFTDDANIYAAGEGGNRGWLELNKKVILLAKPKFVGVDGQNNEAAWVGDRHDLTNSVGAPFFYVDFEDSRSDRKYRLVYKSYEGRIYGVWDRRKLSQKLPDPHDREGSIIIGFRSGRFLDPGIEDQVRNVIANSIEASKLVAGSDSGSYTSPSPVN